MRNNTRNEIIKNGKRNKGNSQALDLSSKLYKSLSKVGVLLSVSKDKRPLSSWKDKRVSDPLKNNRMAIIPNRGLQDNDIHLLILDIDTKHGGKGLDSFNNLNIALFDIFDNLPFTVKTPSGGYHIYLFKKGKINLKRYYSQFKDIEFICEDSGYAVTPINPTNQPFEYISGGETNKGFYELLNDEFINDFDSYLDKTNNIIETIESYMSSLNNNKSDNNDEVEKVSNKNANKHEVELEDLNKLLDWNNHMREDYNEWLITSGAYKNAGGSFDYWVNWSQQADNAETDIKKLESKWNELPTDKLTIGTLYYNALENKAKYVQDKLIDEKITRIRHFEDSDKLSVIKEYPAVPKSKINLDSFKDSLEDKYKELSGKNISVSKLTKLINAIWDKEFYNAINKYAFEKDTNEVSDGYLPNQRIRMKYSDLLAPYLVVGKEFVENDKTIEDIKVKIDDLMTNSYVIKGDLGKAIYYKDSRSNELIRLPINHSNRHDFEIMVNSLFNFKHEKYGVSYIDFNQLRSALISYSDDYIKVNSTSILRGKLEVDTDNKIIFDNNIPRITKCDLPNETKKRLLETYNNHWDNKIENVTKLLTISKYIANKKGLDIALLANSNFGKGFHFNQLEFLGAGSFIPLKDFIKNGKDVNNIPLDKYLSNFIIFDETQHYPRDLFDITDTVRVRELYKSAIDVKIGAKLFLSADGGVFNNSSLDRQILNRAIILDFRNKNTKIEDLISNLNKEGLEVTKDELARVVREYYANKVVEWDNMAKNASQNELLDIVNEIKLSFADVEINDSFKSFEERLEETMIEFVNNPSLTTVNLRDKLFVSKSGDKFVLRNPSKYINELLVDYDADLENELKYKKVKQFEKVPFLRVGSIRTATGIVHGLIIEVPTILKRAKELNLELNIDNLITSDNKSEN